jgi:hypothetical protein
LTFRTDSKSPRFSQATPWVGEVVGRLLRVDEDSRTAVDAEGEVLAVAIPRFRHYVKLCILLAGSSEPLSLFLRNLTIVGKRHIEYKILWSLSLTILTIVHARELFTNRNSSPGLPVSSVRLSDRRSDRFDCTRKKEIASPKW